MARPKKNLTQTPDLENLSQDDAMKLLRQLLAEKEERESKAVEAKASSKDADTLKSLHAAVIDGRRKVQAARRLAEEAADEAVYEVKNISNHMVSASVTDVRGDEKRVLWRQRGELQYLTASQISEIQTMTRFFEDGILAAPEVLPENPNVIEDIDAFVASLEGDIRERLAKITSTDTLYSLYHHLEGLRFQMDGQELKEVPLTVQQQMVLNEVMFTLRARTGVNFSATSPE